MSRWGSLAVSPSHSSRAAGLALSVYRPQYIALEAWVLRKLRRVDHEWRVLRNAPALFDLFRGRHKLNRRARDLLALGAIVHDVAAALIVRPIPNRARG